MTARSKVVAAAFISVGVFFAPRVSAAAESGGSSVTDLIENEVSGGGLSLENELILALAADPREFEATSTLAISEAIETQRRIRDIEIFLKTASPEGDLTVITAGDDQDLELE